LRNPDLKDTALLARTADYMDHWVKEAILIWLNLSNLKQRYRIHSSLILELVINILQRNRHQKQPSFMEGSVIVS
jgi:predicted nucleic acid-binding protein